jgi:putative membrane protein
MTGWLDGAYLWVKAVHVIVIIFWIAGLFMLPRYLAYQAATAPGSEQDRVWVERIGRLKRVILTPTLILTWVFGLALAFSYGFVGPQRGWLHAKIALVLALSGYHGWAAATARKMAAGRRPYSEKTLRLLNEIPGFAVVLIVILVVVKPF